MSSETAAQVRAAEKSNDPNYMLSLERGLAVIRAFGSGRRQLTIADTARATGLSTAAARRCLHTLQKLGYVSGARGSFGLTPLVLTLGYSYLSAAPLAQHLGVAMNQLAETLHESCSLTILDRTSVVIIAAAHPSTERSLRMNMAIGRRLPAYCTSTGRVLLAAMSPAQLSSYFSRVKLVKHTERTIVDRARLRAAIEEARAAGYSIVEEEVELGVRMVGVPVKAPTGKVISAINVAMQAKGVDHARIKDLYVPSMLRAADAIGAVMAQEDL